MTVNTHEQRHGSKMEWLTPLWIFEALGVEFDLDVCAPVGRPTHVPAARSYTIEVDGLLAPWQGRVWMNPPFGTANGVHEWLHRFYQHGNGIGIIRADTPTSWWHDYVSQSPVIVLPRGRVRYINNNEGQEKAHGGPGFASALFCAGDECAAILRDRGHRIGAAWDRAAQTTNSAHAAVARK
ncbi:MAG: DNA N-6-adenine-methyltransferase [Pseudomonadota bacterium]